MNIDVILTQNGCVMLVLKTLAMSAHYCLWVSAQSNGSFLVDTALTKVTNKFLVIIHMDMVLVPKVFISVIFDYFSFNHL
jgi:hypothetical protein